MFSIGIFEGIGLLIMIFAFVLLLIASIRLLRANNIPGSRLIFLAIIGTFIGAFLPIIEIFFIVDEDSYIFEGLVNIFLALMFLVGAYGFWCLAKYSISNSANKALSSEE